MIVKLKKCFLAFFKINTRAFITKKAGLVIKQHKNPTLIKF
ncbi:hypothetical protein HPIN_01675 [Helicobacter pylori India7]|uniref:Uncharacterized protein n=1 Tax=Helicobacter pylori (strain India7) TaxID=907238 RepID=E8QF14_HELP7|nr:hypothetical protein HPIN_01675 [Helicobacter pylori India7]